MQIGEHMHYACLSACLHVGLLLLIILMDMDAWMDGWMNEGLLLLIILIVIAQFGSAVFLPFSPSTIHSFIHCSSILYYPPPSSSLPPSLVCRLSTIYGELKAFVNFALGE